MSLNREAKENNVKEENTSKFDNSKMFPKH